MKSKRRHTKAHKEMLDAATTEFKRTGHVPPLRLRENAATGEVIVSSLPDDCEDGMRRTTRQLPNTRNKPNQ